MNRVLAAILVSMLIAGLAGCARPAGGSDGAASATPSPGAAGAGTLSPTMQLVVGTFRLEGGDLAVDAAQAAELLPLWRAFLSLNRSDATAAPEVEALMAQIQEAMTPEQARAIAEMALTSEDMAALMQELGLGAMAAARGAAGREGGTSGQGATGGAGRGGGAGGAFPPGGLEGGLPGGGRELPPGMMPGGQTPGVVPDAARAAGVRAAALTPLVEALIELLASKA